MSASINLNFETLSKERLDEALALIKKCFPDDYESGVASYKACLENEKHFDLWTTQLDYWLVIDESTNKIVALTGLYQDIEQGEDEIWLGWFCVDPDQRRQGIGRQTLEWTIDQARSRGYKYFRLWTSDDPSEVPAQSLFESLGLKIFREKMDVKRGFKVVHRELKL